MYQVIPRKCFNSRVFLHGPFKIALVRIQEHAVIFFFFCTRIFYSLGKRDFFLCLFDFEVLLVLVFFSEKKAATLSTNCGQYDSISKK
jgi:hypothetical protein